MSLLIQLFQWNMAEPKMYGLFHLLCLFLTGMFIELFLKREVGEKQVRIILGMSSVLVIGLEIYKQLYYSIDFQNGITFHYRWNIFPWQFCSTPMYIGLLGAMMKNRNMHYRLCCYLSTYALMAGICVMLYPSSVFTENVIINIQTMVNHGTMVVIGMYLLLSGYVRCEKETLVEALKVFIICLMIAIILNECAYGIGIVEQFPFNMFYISPYVEGSLPVFGQIQKVVSYPMSLLIYVVGFSIGSSLILWFVKRRLLE